MSYYCIVDAKHRVVRVTFSGEITGDALYDAVNSVANLDRTYEHFRHVWDGYEIRMLDVEYKQLLRIVHLLKTRMHDVMARCPGAVVVAARQVDFVIAKAIHLMVGSPRPFRILRDRASLQRWIEEAENV